MSSKLKAVIGIAAFACFIGAAAFVYNNLSGKVAPEIEAEQIGDESRNGGGESDGDKIKAPDFTVLDGDGNSVKLSDKLGTPVVLNFWASWCPPCKSEMPEFEEAWEEFGPDVTFMMVNLVDGQTETIETGAQYVAEQGFTFPVYFDSEQEAARAYGISAIPVTLFIDKEGYIITGAQGAISGEALRKGIGYITE